MIDRIKNLKTEIENLKAASAQEVEQLRIKYLSKKGQLNDLFTAFRELSSDQKREVGAKLNELKSIATDKINSLRDSLGNKGVEVDTTIDLTRTPSPRHSGSRHPLSIVNKEIIDIFGRMGFSIADGPEIEDDWHVFSSLNFPADHPARDMQDTFFISRDPIDILLRTHTSSVQTRTMEKVQPPLRVLCPGRVYRNEAISARAHFFFHQV